MTKPSSRGRAVAVVAGAAAFGAMLAGGTAYAHGSCSDIAGIPGFVIPNQVIGSNTYECTYSHATMKSCVQLQWRSATASTWTNIGTQNCITSNNSPYEYVTKTVTCTTGYWRSRGTGEARNSDGVVAHSTTQYSSERFITCA